MTPGRNADGLFSKFPENPILTATDWPYPANAVFNPAADQVGSDTLLLVRVEDRRGFSHLTVARSANGLTHWGDHRCIIRTRQAYWDCHRIGLACQPIETSEGWLLF